MPDTAPVLTCDSTGRLHCSTDTTETLFLPWPAMQAYQRVRPDGPWVGLRPQFAIPPEPVSGVEEHGVLEVVNEFCARIPRTTRRIVAAFPERHWDVLTWAARTGVLGADLLAANTALALAFACETHRHRRRTARTAHTELQYLLSVRKQAQILARLGFPPTERVRKILRKIQPRAVTQRGLVRLRKWLADEGVADALSRLPTIDHSVMSIIERGLIRRTAFAALLRVTREDQERAADPMIRMRADALRVWQAPLAAQPDAPTTTPQRRASSPRSLIDFPPPPVPGTDVIVPILSGADLAAEGHAQQNCVASLDRQIRTRRIAIYRVLYPERCTLSVKRSRDRWVVDQLEAARNKRALPGTFRAVEVWLRNHQGSVPPPNTQMMTPTLSR